MFGEVGGLPDRVRRRAEEQDGRAHGSWTSRDTAPRTHSRQAARWR